MPFVKGKSGNPGGRPKKDPEIQALLEKLTPQAIKTLAEVMRSAKSQPSARVTAALGLLRKTLPDLSATELSGSMSLTHEEALDELDDGTGKDN